MGDWTVIDYPEGDYLIIYNGWLAADTLKTKNKNNKQIKTLTRLAILLERITNINPYTNKLSHFDSY